MDIGGGAFLHGDCLELMRGLPSGSVDMVLCDLPYGTTACSWDSVIPFDLLWEQYWRICKPNAAVVLTSGQPFTTALIASQMQNFKYTWVWEKPQGVDPFMTKVRPLNNVEDVCVFGRGKIPYLPQMEEGKPYSVTRDKTPRNYEITKTEMIESTTVNSGTRYPKRVLRFNQQRGFHPTQKPVALFEYLIRTYTNPGDTVLDNTAGSGTTAIAAEQSGRRWICMERDPEYYAAALGRVWDHVHV